MRGPFNLTYQAFGSIASTSKRDLWQNIDLQVLACLLTSPPTTFKAIARTMNEENRPMIGENRQLVTDEPVVFEKEPVDVQDCRKITDHFKGIYRRIYPNLIKET